MLVVCTAAFPFPDQAFYVLCTRYDQGNQANIFNGENKEVTFWNGSAKDLALWDV